MHLFVTLTYECNLRCSYCYGKCCDDFGSDCDGFGEIDYTLPEKMSYDTSALKAFSEKERMESLILYGGEPLLNIGRVREIMDEVPAEKFMMHTNGLLLDELEPRYLRMLHTVLVSIDGEETLTDRYRGRGVYQRAITNIRNIRERGFTGELIARMTVGAQTKIDEQVWHLLFKERVFDSVHWQLDAQFWRNDYNPAEFSRWVRSNYTPRLLHLIDRWVQRMEEESDVLKIYPLLGVAETLLTGEQAGLRCGAGWAQFNVQTDGVIVPCPAMSGMRDYYLGDIRCTTPEEVRRRSVSVGTPCTGCGLLQVCGGRCLYANVTKLWSEDGFKLVCGTVGVLVDGLRTVLPRMRRLLEEGRISMRDFKYTRFNSCEIIP